MRKLFFGLAAAAMMLSASTLTNRAEAMTLGTPAGLHAAIDDIALTESVHCRRYKHWHSWGYGYGCHGAAVVPLVVVPAPTIVIRRGHGHHHHHHRHRR